MPNEMTWTPGPWRVKIEGSFTRFYFDCHAIDPTVTREELEANTRLCAAAPELYEALDLMMRGGESWLIVSTKARAALAKARGESAVQSPGDHQESNPGSQGGQNNG